MKHWSVWVMGLATVCAVAAGCCQPVFMAEKDFNLAAVPLEFASHGHAPKDLLPDPPDLVEPATTFNPNREPWHLTLTEAIAIALEHGTTGAQSVNASGTANLDLVSFSGRGVTGSDSIRVLALNPAQYGASIETALARFDAIWTTSMNWTTTDEPAQGFGAFNNGQAATFSSSLAKLLPTGGAAGLTFTTNYEKLVNIPPFGSGAAFLNPAYTTRLQFGIEQPLLRGAGETINQLLGGPPSSTLFPGLNSRVASGAQNEGILVTRLRFDQSRAEFEREVSYLLLNVETAYWNLYGAYVNLYSTEQALLQAYEAWKISREKYEAGRIDISDFAPTRGQYESFRGDRLQALEQILDSERTLRTLLGLPASDGKRLVPIDPPTLAPYYPDWQKSVEEALRLRPELVMARQDLKARQLNLLAQRDLLKPDLRFSATYTPVGLGNSLEGNATFIDATGSSRSTNALRSLASNHFDDWTAMLTLNVPLGFRAENALVRQARLQLEQSYFVLKDQEKKAQTFLATQYSQLLQAYQTIEARRSERLAYADQLRARFDRFVAGTITIDFLLTAQQQWASALSQEYQAIVTYNNTLARFEFAKGTLLQHDNVVISEGPLPKCAVQRAVEHERQRSKAIVLRERADPVKVLRVCKPPNSCGLPALPTDSAPNLVSLFADVPPHPPNLEEVPAEQTAREVPAQRIVKEEKPAEPKPSESKPIAVEAPKAEPKPPAREAPKPEKKTEPSAEILRPEDAESKTESP